MAGLFDFDPDAERLGLLPHPRGMLKSEGRGSVMSPGVDWTDWIAPEALVDIVRAVKAPAAAARGEPVDIRDALNVGLNVLGANIFAGPTMEPGMLGMAGKLRRDNPGGDWIRRHIERRKEFEKEIGGPGIPGGPVTGYYRDPVPWDQGGIDTILFDPKDLIGIPGAMGEHLPGKDTRGFGMKAENIRKWLASGGEVTHKDPIFIAVDYKGRPFVMEGNNRLAVYAEQGRPTIPTELRYFSGGEDVPGMFDPLTVERLRKDMPVVPTEKAVIEVTQSRPAQSGFADRGASYRNPAAYVVKRGGTPVAEITGSPSKYMQSGQWQVRVLRGQGKDDKPWTSYFKTKREAVDFVNNDPRFLEWLK